ncbi:protein adenylyltransferase SelO [Scleromatobacter humisilvae]|uniref:Protein nucleotidyltransferase YdiU n=1 Tax=Scleromatobacter humisilvae TaxID=2897159 RepID=A0A9X2C1C2_9BURK|nr:YdiU family protein [Scleromatobacter humisilvae]MCK9687436.1 YdiU family protein [Scleromatobacter humisilvae]
MTDTAPIGPDPSNWINRFARFTQDVPDVRRDDETAPSPVRRHTFGTDLPAQAFPDPHWVATSDDCAALLGWPADWATRDDWRAIDVLTGRATWPGLQTMATVYSGHQFGVWAGQLGDGRALLLGEWQARQGEPSFELQLKGAGRTPYSRMGDGRAVLRSSIREFLCSEAMHALGVPTTRALAVAGSALPVMRETMETGAVVTRVAPSFLRFGHFEHFAHTDQHDALRRLVDFTIATCFPDLAGGQDGLDPLHAWLAEVVRRTAAMVAHWQAVGFAHGVMNTDNMSILGLTIDYGPFGFLDGFDPGHICNHSDTGGRYAFARQPNVAWWNLHALGHALKPLCDDPDTTLPAVLDTFGDHFVQAYSDRMRAKLGLELAQDGDKALLDDLLGLLAAERVDHTIAMRALGAFDRGTAATPSAFRDHFIDRGAADAWGERYLHRLESETRSDADRRAAMDRVNPKYILRNHLAQNAIDQASKGDFGEVRALHELLRRPYDEQPGNAHYAALPPDWARHIEVSCSS